MRKLNDLKKTATGCQNIFSVFSGKRQRRDSKSSSIENTAHAQQKVPGRLDSPENEYSEAPHVKVIDNVAIQISDDDDRDHAENGSLSVVDRKEGEDEEKAMHFNFFDFCDFNLVEYDTYDKLQNGDMNWLLPRKFLAFIGPTEGVIANGHPPHHYIRYFLENDIKTVIRLNNKVYDSSVFINAGIEHHELFFPDGSVPTKQILLRFLNLSETARAAIAVHCKAGLGRTGSLIGAYIIKHYRMSAREAIAWMRMCRPGSVIGQQQGWLEEIEMWLWRQGNNFRLQHFGDGDKIPHHKYGIYSKVWPIEREKLIRHVQKRRLESQRSMFREKVNTDNFKKSVSFEVPQIYNYYNLPQEKDLKTHSRPKIPIRFSKNDENKIKPKLNLLNKKHQTANDVSKVDTKSNIQYTGEVLNRSVKPKRLLSSSKLKERCIYGTNTTPKNEVSQRSVKQQDTKTCQMKLRKRNQSENRDQYATKKVTPRIQTDFVHNLEQTQGDKLNEIKAKRLLAFFHREDQKNQPGTSRKKAVTMKRPQASTIYTTKM
ncbi:hypothetical protein RN001_002216 [Aquatica leii]|uniref:protein-tyrosine-phosphatase n=1 Tax=Aquatica leii TaxID=1421715 RepID=A0AAN7SSS9_9COLE|nr:hypothetical protein RN001_002216 [Aquatica leii]